MHSSCRIVLPLLTAASVFTMVAFHQVFVADHGRRSVGLQLRHLATGNHNASSVGVFVVVGNASTGSWSKELQDVLDYCVQSAGVYRLYVVHYGVLNKSDVDRLRVGNNRNCPSSSAMIVAPDPGQDARVLNYAMMNAYIDNGIDQFHVILINSPATAAAAAATTASRKQWLPWEILQQKHAAICVEESNRRSSTSYYFSRTHFDIFGLFLPHSIPTLPAATEIVADVYRKFGLTATIDVDGHVVWSNESRGMDAKWPDVYRQDSETLERYLSAVRSSKCFRCAAASRPGDRRVISMSLYGSSRRYTMGAIRNAQLAPVTFPGWQLRFYTRKDGIPARVRHRLLQLGAEIAVVNSSSKLAPMMWRFTVLEDTDVDVFIVRDADSRLTPRDATVVDDWLRQGPNISFHCIRDHPSHSHFSVSGGLWGGRREGLMAIFNNSYRSSMSKYGHGYIQDMHFLGQVVWPRVRSVAYCHDSFSCTSYPSSHPFPVKRIGFEHLGQVYNELSLGRQGDIDILKGARINKKCVPP